MLTDILEGFHDDDAAKHPTEKKLTPFKAKDAAPAEFVNVLKSMKTFMDNWPDQESNTKALRASGLYFTCPREFVLNYWQPKANRSFDWKSQFMMSTGTSIHDYVQNKVLGPMGILHGDWVCHKEHLSPGGMTVHPETVKRGFHPDPEKSIYEIQHQTDLTWRYVEYQHWDPQWRIGGHTDGLICENRIKWIYENRKLYKADPLKAYRELAGCGLDQEMILFELKTAGNYVYDKIDNPDAIAEYYKMQANVYQAMTGIGKTMFWYMKRDDYTSKAFIYEYDQKWWDLAKRKAQIIWEAIRDESLPESMMLCKLPSDKRAKECAHGETCWMNARKLDWPKYVADGKARAEAEGRKLLDLSTWTAEPKDESLTT